jgi:nucleoid-associated protein YgaU
LQSVRAYYQQAGELAASGDNQAALAVIRRGLQSYDAAELHLLGAILCRRLGQVDEMRRHVAAIPVDDSLRAEAEWLIRSQPASDDRAGVPDVDDPALAALLTPPVPPAEPYPLPRRKSRWVTLAIVLTAIAFTWLLTQLDLLPRDVALSPSASPEMAATVVPPAADQDPVGASQGITADTTREEASPAGDATEATAPATKQPVLLPTPTISPDLVQQPTEPQPLAAAEDSGPNGTTQFDLAAYLTELGNEELADLGVTANLDDDRLGLTGYVATFVQREELLEVAQTLPGIEEVNATELYIRPPATYTVQEGDSLWSITYNVYGDMTRMQDVYQANRDVMASPESLTIGMILQLPPYE